MPVLCGPGAGATETFIGIGTFDSLSEAEAALKYVKIKFVRALIGILKMTRDLTSSKWGCVPLQDFSEMSDIRWDASVNEINQQLYEKYSLPEEEINYIESYVKEMC